MGRTKTTTNAVDKDTEEQEVKTAVKTVAIPRYVDDILKMHSELPKVYVSKYGGAFTPETSEAIRGNAKLYDNPYHNK